MANNYYDILGVSRGASADDIQKAYRKLAHQYHPDKTGGDDAKFKEINAAYQVLKDPQKRAQYDQFGQTFEQGRAGGFGDFAQGFGANGFQFDLNDLFGDMFGGGSRTRTRSGRVGADIEVELTIPFRDAVFGASKTLTLEKQIACAVCKGNGAEPGSGSKTCGTCTGTGTVARTIGFGIAMQAPCTECSGAGSIPEKRCAHCRGRGTVRGEKVLTVKIPAGIDDGQTIRIAGEGQAGEQGAPAGSLFIRVQVVPDQRFKRKGFDIHTNAEISFAQAALGDKIEVETLDGVETLKIGEGTQSGAEFKLRGKGVPHLQGKGRGDHFVHIKVLTPTHLSRKQRKLLEDFDRE